MNNFLRNFVNLFCFYSQSTFITSTFRLWPVTFIIKSQCVIIELDSHEEKEMQKMCLDRLATLIAS